MSKKNYDRRKDYKRIAHCGISDFGYNLTIESTLWILEYPGIGIIPRKDACPCCLNIVRIGQVRFS